MSKSIHEKQKARLKDYKACFQNPSGERVLHDLSRNFGMFSTTFTPNEPHTSAFREGQRSVVVQILSVLKTDQKKIEEHFKKYEEESFNE
jgi:hypothetical protein